MTTRDALAQIGLIFGVLVGVAAGIWALERAAGVGSRGEPVAAVSGDSHESVPFGTGGLEIRADGGIDLGNMPNSVIYEGGPGGGANCHIMRLVGGTVALVYVDDR